VLGGYRQGVGVLEENTRRTKVFKSSQYKAFVSGLPHLSFETGLSIDLAMCAMHCLPRISPELVLAVDLSRNFYLKTNAIEYASVRIQDRDIITAFLCVFEYQWLYIVNDGHVAETVNAVL
jgi:hypothetical protein